MALGIAVVGGNGSGKSTFGKALADMLGYKHIDVEDYAFRDSAVPYTEPRPVSEMREMIFRDIQKHGDFVLSSVGGDMGEEINALYKTIVYIQVPLDVRMERVKQRAIDRFGNRVLAGGDMYAREQEFLNFVAVRTLERTDSWVQKAGLPVIYVDGTALVTDTAQQLAKQLTAQKATE